MAAIEQWEKPKTVSELRAYLGFCNYYSGYIKMYAEYAAPMTTMLKGNREETKKGSKKALVWTAESDRAFEGMKQALLSAVGLHLVDPDRGFVLRTDASDYAIGAVLEQVLDDGRHVPVAFWSRVLAEGQRRTWTPRGKGGVCHRHGSQEMGWVHSPPSRHRLHRPSESAVVAQGARGHPLRSRLPTGKMA